MDKDGLMAEATFEPDYEGECDCGQTPTVNILEDGEVTHHSGLCGPCFFGTAKALCVSWWLEFKHV